MSGLRVEPSIRRSLHRDSAARTLTHQGAYSVMLVEKNVSEFLRSTFRSIWSLELLFLLADDAARCWSSQEMVTALRASELVVKQAVDNLNAAGLLVPEQGGCFRYAPPSAEVRKLVISARSLYAHSPDAVRRMIIRSQSNYLLEFAEAFKFRKD